MEIIDYFKICSDETRLRILLLLKEKSLCVCQMQSILEVAQSKLSKHLSKMRDLKMVKATQEGKFVIYSLNEDLFLANILQAVEKQGIFVKDQERINEFDHLLEVSSCGSE